MDWKNVPKEVVELLRPFGEEHVRQCELFRVEVEKRREEFGLKAEQGDFETQEEMLRFVAAGWTRWPIVATKLVFSAEDGGEAVGLQPFLSRGEVVKLRPEDKAVLVPVQLFRGSQHGSAILRVGETTFWFVDGEYDGTEAHLKGEAEAPEVTALLEQSAKNRGLAPARAYFQSGTPGYEAETAAWPGGDLPS